MIKIIYEENNFYHVDAVRVFIESEHCRGTTIKKLNTSLDFDKLSKDSQQYKDIKRFSWFSLTCIKSILIFLITKISKKL